MKIYALGIYGIEQETVKNIYNNSNLEDISIFYRYFVSNYLHNVGLNLSDKLKEYRYYNIKEEKYGLTFSIFGYNNGYKRAIILCENSYDLNTGFNIAKKLCYCGDEEQYLKIWEKYKVLTVDNLDKNKVHDDDIIKNQTLSQIIGTENNILDDIYTIWC